MRRARSFFTRQRRNLCTRIHSWINTILLFSRSSLLVLDGKNGSRLVLSFSLFFRLYFFSRTSLLALAKNGHFSSSLRINSFQSGKRSNQIICRLLFPFFSVRNKERLRREITLLFRSHVQRPAKQKEATEITQQCDGAINHFAQGQSHNSAETKS